jgi:hypothetical protein
MNRTNIMQRSLKWCALGWLSCFVAWNGRKMEIIPLLSNTKHPGSLTCLLICWTSHKGLVDAHLSPSVNYLKPLDFTQPISGLHWSQTHRCHVKAFLFGEPFKNVKSHRYLQNYEITHLWISGFTVIKTNQKHVASKGGFHTTTSKLCMTSTSHSRETTILYWNSF